MRRRDAALMALALAEARRAVGTGDVPVGAVVVDRGRRDRRRPPATSVRRPEIRWPMPRSSPSGPLRPPAAHGSSRTTARSS